MIIQNGFRFLSLRLHFVSAACVKFATKAIPFSIRSQLVKPVLGLALLTALCILTGCSTYPVQVTRGDLPRAYPLRHGPIAVADFTDTRPIENKASIGAATGGFGNHLGDFVVKDGKPINSVMQSFFEDALRQSGYEIVPTNDAPVVLEGEVYQWALSSGWNCVDRIGVLVRVRDQKSGDVLWEKKIYGQEDDMMSPKNAVRAAVDVTLANAINEFTSLDFYNAVQHNEPASAPQK